MADKIDGEEEKSLYLKQIQYLDEQSESCQLKYEELEEQNKDLVSQYSAQVRDRKNTIEPLKRSLVAKEKRVDELAEQLEIERTITKDTEALKVQCSQQIQELKEQADELNIVTVMQEAKSEELREQLMQSTELMESMKKQLVSQRREHEVAIHRLMMEAELEKEKMTEAIEKKMAHLIQEATSSMQEEQAGYREQLEVLNQGPVIQKDIDFLRVRRRVLNDKKDELSEDVSRISHENRTLKMEENQLRTTYHQEKAEREDCIITHKHMLTEEEHLRLDKASVSEECRLQTAEASQLGADLQGYRSWSRQLSRTGQEAVIILRHIMAESEKASDTQWKTKRVQEILESSAFNIYTKKSSRGSKDH